MPTTTDESQRNHEQQSEMTEISQPTHDPGSDAQRLVIIDGYALFYRAYMAMPSDLQTSSGEPTGAVRGFTASLFRIIENLDPTHLVMALDVADGGVFRRWLYPPYKGNREPMPDDLPPQIDRSKEVAAAFSIPMFEAPVVEGFNPMDAVLDEASEFSVPTHEAPTYEADDVIAALADQAASAGIETWICTVDSDLVQLVTDKVFVYMFRPFQRDYVRYDSVAAVRDRYGIDPIQMIDYKALVGDNSDNIPGVKGIGDKTAVKLLNVHRDIEEIYDNIDSITPARAQKALIAGKREAFLFKDIIAIRHDAPIQLDLDAAVITDFDRASVRKKFEELEFRQLINTIPFASQEAVRIDVSYDLVTDAAKLQEWVDRAAKAPLLAVDLETSSTDTIDCDIAGYALTDKENSGCYIPVGHRGEAIQLDHEMVRSALRPVFENPLVPKVLHNAKFDMKVLRRHGIHLRGLQDDTMVAAFVLNKPQIGLKALASSEIGVEMTPIEELIGKGRKQISMVDVPPEKAGKYAAADADITFRLAKVLLPEMKENNALENFYRQLEMPLIPLLVDMELAGVTLDTDILRNLDEQLNGEITKKTRRIYEEAGREFNIGSPKQLSGVLFDQLGLPKTRKTSQGYSTDAQQLEQLVDAHPIVNHILQWRELTKLRSTYVESLPNEVHESTGRVHTDYNQTVAATGRLSSESPNLQNIPVRTEQGRQIRAAFVAKPWSELPDDVRVRFVSADYSQIELRVLAHLSKDEGLITAFRNGEDIHAATASGAYDVSIDEVQPEMRRVAKMMNFGVIYGLTAHGLAQRSGMDRRRAQDFIDAYFGRFKRVAEWIEEVKSLTRELGYAETLLGRRRYLPEINSKLFRQKMAAERMAVNMPVQGTAADVMKRAMIDIDSALGNQELRSRMLLQVHDELIFEVPDEEVDQLATLLNEIMPASLNLVVPLQIEVKSASNWRDLEALQVN